MFPIGSKAGNESEDDAFLDDNNYQGYFTIDEAIEKAGFGRFQWKVLIMCGLCWSADAMEIMLLSFLLPEIKREWNLESWKEATVGSAVFFGMMLGAYFWGSISDRLGRRIGFFATSAFAAVFGIASAFSPNLIVLVILRALVGFGLGGSPVSFSLFAEFLPTSKRGVPLILFEVFWTIGTMAEAGLAWAVLPTLGWRWLLGISTIPLALLLLFFPFLPESPRYLLIVGKREEAAELLEKIAKTNKKELPPGKLVRAPENVQHARILDLLTPSLRLLSFLLWIIWFANSFVYYGLVLFTPAFFQNELNQEEPNAPAEDQTVYLNTFITTCAELPGLILSALIVDRMGRKFTQSFEFGLCGIFFLLLMVPDLSYEFSLLCACLSRMFIMGSFSTTYVYTPEVYPTSVRATGLGICSAWAKLAGIVTPYIAELFNDFAEWIPIAIYGGVALLAAIASAFLPVETSRRALQDTVKVSSKRYGSIALEKEPEYTSDGSSIGDDVVVVVKGQRHSREFLPE